MQFMSLYYLLFYDKFIKLKPGFHYPSWRPELTGNWFPLPVNTGRVDGRTVPLAELMGHVHPSTRVVETGLYYSAQLHIVYMMSYDIESTVETKRSCRTETATFGTGYEQWAATEPFQKCFKYVIAEKHPLSHLHCHYSINMISKRLPLYMLVKKKTQKT